MRWHARPWRGDRGARAAEVVIAVPLLMLLILLIVQFAIWAHASSVAQATAEEALAAARVQGGSAAAGQQRADQVLGQIGSSVLISPHVTVTRTGATATAIVQITGTAEEVLPVPGLAFPCTSPPPGQSSGSCPIPVDSAIPKGRRPRTRGWQRPVGESRWPGSRTRGPGDVLVPPWTLKSGGGALFRPVGRRIGVLAESVWPVSAANRPSFIIAVSWLRQGQPERRQIARLADLPELCFSLALGIDVDELAEFALQAAGRDQGRVGDGAEGFVDGPFDGRVCQVVGSAAAIGRELPEPAHGGVEAQARRVSGLEVREAMGVADHDPAGPACEADVPSEDCGRVGDVVAEQPSSPVDHVDLRCVTQRGGLLTLRPCTDSPPLFRVRVALADGAGSVAGPAFAVRRAGRGYVVRPGESGGFWHLGCAIAARKRRIALGELRF